METLIYVISSIVVAIGIVYTLISFYIARSLYHPMRRSLLETKAMEDERHPGIMARYDMWVKEAFTVSSRYGYDLKAYYIAAPKPSKKFVIIAHGYTYTHHGSVKYAVSMRKQNYNVIMYDEPFHGESEGKHTTLGYYEKDDLETIITYVTMTYGDDIILGLYGESMGAATSLLEQADDDRIDFVIADCGFADLWDLMAYQLKEFHHLPPRVFLPAANFFFKRITKADIKDISPIKAVKKAKTPIFFVHGEADEYIPQEHSIRMYEACPSKKDILIIGNQAEHAQSWGKNTAVYEERLFVFLEDVEDEIILKQES